MWIACTNRETIKVAARNGLGALAFSFIDPDEARSWVDVYYDIIKSEECVPLGHTVNANIALVTGFSLHDDRAEAIRRGQEGFEFFGYALNALVAHDQRPGRTDLWGEFQSRRRPDSAERRIAEAEAVGRRLRQLHRHARRRPPLPRPDARRRRRPGDLHPAGGPEPS